MSTVKYDIYVSERAVGGQKDAGLSQYRVEADGTAVLKAHYPLGSSMNVSCFDASCGLLYVCGDSDNPQKKQSGDRILVFRRDSLTGALTSPLQELPTLCQNPAFLTKSPDGRYLVCANHTYQGYRNRVLRTENGWESVPEYDDSTVVLYGLDAAGMITGVLDVVFHTGTGKLRSQANAHPHCCVFSPDGSLLAVPDKGSDRVYLYRVVDNRLVPAAEPYCAAEGTEPRFCVFHPVLPYLYVNHEGDTGVEVLRYTPEGQLFPVQSIDAGIPKEERIPGKIYENQGIAIHPDGSTLYSAVRAENAVMVYRIRPEDGTLALLQKAPCGAEFTRCCQISADGGLLAAGDRITGELVLFTPETDGTLRETGRVKNTAGVQYVLPVPAE